MQEKRKAEQWLAGKELMRERHLHTIRIFFLSLKSGVRSFDKVTSKANRWKENEKSFIKIDFLWYFLYIKWKMFSITCSRSFYTLSRCIQSTILNFVAHGHELDVEYWHTQQTAWCFMVILSLPVPNNTVQSFSEAKDSSLSRFLFVIVTPRLLI